MNTDATNGNSTEGQPVAVAGRQVLFVGGSYDGMRITIADHAMDISLTRRGEWSDILEAIFGPAEAGSEERYVRHFLVGEPKGCATVSVFAPARMGQRELAAWLCAGYCRADAIA